ncbi:MAG: hypothetical protein P4L33_16805 [Capsulimonadaceae bacterium]|nr:hypothetical protein [Capsulimonadaceae bacterium]
MTIRIETPDDFDFTQCLNAHGWKSLLPFKWDAAAGTLERVEAFARNNTVLLRVRAFESVIEVETAEDIDANEIARRVRHMLQLDLAIDRFHSYCAASPVLQHIPSARQGRMLRSATLFEDVTKVIATTNTSWSQTKGMVARIVDAFGSPLPDDPTRRAFPRPDQIAAVSLDTFSEQARMGYRNAAVHRIATDVASGALDLESWLDQEIASADLYKRFVSLPGVGPYAASCLMIYSGRYDRVNIDSWARMMVGKELGRPVSDKEVQAFFEPYGEWKALVYHFYPWREAEPEY